MKARGFTLVELIVAITISAVVMVFAAMFIGAPLGAYETHSLRAALVADTSGAWPRMEMDLRTALPSSLRARRNGNFVVLELLPVMDVARYKTPVAAFPMTTAGVYRGAGMPQFLSVNPGADVYTLTGSMAPATNISITPNPVTEENTISVNPAPVFTDSPRHLIYFVSWPVTYLCDEGQGTLRRYQGYTIATLQTARDTPGELTAAGAVGTLVTQGLTSCNFAVALVGTPTPSQTAAVRLTTTRNGDSVTLLHSSHAEYVP